MPPEQPITPVSPTQIPIQPPQTSHKLLRVLVLVLLIVGGVSAYGFYFYKPAQNTQPVLNTATSTWQTYRNQEYGFAIEIPIDWVVEKVTTSHDLLFVSSTTRNEILENENCFKESIYCDYHLIKWDLAFSINELSKGDSLGDIETVDINGIQFKIYSLGGLYDYFVFETIRDNKIYSFVTIQKENGLRHLSTFRFIE